MRGCVPSSWLTGPGGYWILVSMWRVRAADLLFWSALLLVGLVATADMLDATTSMAGCVAVAPPVAAILCSPMRTAVVSLVTLVVGLWLVATQGNPQLLTSAVRAGVVVLAAIVAPVLAAARTGREQRIQDLTRVAKVAQLAVLTPIPPVAGPTRLSSAYESASREALIGGDLYGVTETPRGVRLMIGDVRGKGIDAVRIAAVILAAFRDGALRMSRLTRLAGHCEAQLRPHLVAEDFVTALFADIEHQGRAEFISCGHPGPIHARGDRLVEVEVASPGTPLGFPPEFRVAPRAHRIDLQRGDRLLFYTDALVEARTPSGGFVGVDRLVGDIGTVDFQDALAGVLTRLHAATHEVRDDLALLLVEYTGSVSKPGPESDSTDTEQVATTTADWPDIIGGTPEPPATPSMPLSNIDSPTGTVDSPRRTASFLLCEGRPEGSWRPARFVPRPAWSTSMGVGREVVDGDRIEQRALDQTSLGSCFTRRSSHSPT